MKRKVILERQFSLGNTVCGIFQKYGFFTIKLPVGRPDSYPGYLRIDKPSPNSTYRLFCTNQEVGGEESVGISSICEFEPTLHELELGEMETYLILPIAKNKKEIEAALKDKLFFRAVLYWDLEKGELRYISPLNRHPHEAYRPIYKEGFGYEINCKNEYDFERN